MRKLTWFSIDAENKKYEIIPDDLPHSSTYGLEGDGFTLSISNEDGSIDINGTPLRVSYITAHNDIVPLTADTDALWRKPEWLEDDDSDLPAYKIGYRIRGYRIDGGSWESEICILVPKEKRRPLRLMVSGIIEQGCTGMIEIQFGDMKKRIPTALRPGVPRGRWVRLTK